MCKKLLCECEAKFSSILLLVKAKSIRPLNDVSRPVSGNSSDDGELLEELMNYRRQKWRGAPQKLSCVEESYNTVSESLASVLADGFDIG